MDRREAFLSAALLLYAMTFVTGCTNINKHTLNKTNKVENNSLLARLDSCEKFFATHDQFTDEFNVRDAQYTSVNNYPFLSVNRFLVSFKNELSDEQKIGFWIDEAAKLNIQKRRIEWLNLPESARKSIQQKHLKTVSFNTRIASCSKEFRQNLSLNDRISLIANLKINDDYSTTQRVLGLYPLTSLIVKNQIKKHHRKTRQQFEKKLSELQIKGKLQRYTPDKSNLSFDENVKLENPLGIPFVSSTVVSQLFNQYAPTIEADETGDFDQIGEVALDADHQPFINRNLPTVYTLPSYTRFNGKILLQLNYFFWFSERPAQSSFDIYSGKFDGIIWRVTLDENLQPIIFDSVHNCGCYHKFYTTNKIDFKLDVALQEKEPPFLAQNKLSPIKNAPWILRINTINHFIERVYQDQQFDKTAKFYSMKNYSELRHLTNTTTSKSFFSEDGIVTSSKRSERWILWPMGVPSAGAMRQWGHHATAFVGKRYFDDPYLLDKYFRPAAK